MKKAIASLCVVGLFFVQCAAAAGDWSSVINQQPFYIVGRTFDEMKSTIGTVRTVRGSDIQQVIVTDKGYVFGYYLRDIAPDSRIPSMLISFRDLFQKKNMSIKERKEYLDAHCVLTYAGVSQVDKQNTWPEYEYTYMYDGLYQILLRNPEGTDDKLTDGWEVMIYNTMYYIYAPEPTSDY